MQLKLALYFSFLLLCPTTSSFRESLSQMLRLRALPAEGPRWAQSDCTYLLFGGEDPHFPVVSSLAMISTENSDHFRTVLVLSNHEEPRRNTKSFISKHQFSCAHVLTSPSVFHSGYKYLLDYVFVSWKPSFVHFVFIGVRAELPDLMTSSWVDDLKFKTGLATDTGQIVTNDNGRTQVSDRVLPLPSEHQLMNGRWLNVRMFNAEPHVKFEDGKLVENVGLSYNWLVAARKYYNFSSETEAGLKPLHRLPNGTWAGFMGDLVEGRLDVLPGLAMASQRWEVVDFTGHLLTSIWTFYTSHPDAHVNWLAFVYPLDKSVWALTATMAFIAMLVLYCSFKLRTQDAYEGHFGPTTDWAFLAVIIPLSLLLQEAIRVPARAKYISALLAFFSIVIGTCYTCNLVSYITLPKQDRVPQTFSELAEETEKGSYTANTLYYKGAAASTFFTSTKNPTALKLKQHMTSISDIKLWPTCLQMTATRRKTACLGWKFIIDPMIAKNITVHSSWNPLVASQDHLISVVINVGVRKNSRYLDALNFLVGALRDVGLLSKWMEDFTEYNRKSSRSWVKDKILERDPVMMQLKSAMEKSVAAKSVPFSFSNLGLSFVLLLGGLVLGISSFVCESWTFIMNGFRNLSQVTKKVIIGHTSSVLEKTVCRLLSCKQTTEERDAEANVS